MQGYPQQYVAGTHLYAQVEGDNMELGLEPPTFGSEVQRVNHYITASPQPR